MSFKILSTMVQGSHEWLEYRRTRITATDFAVFMAHKGKAKNIFNKSLHALLKAKVEKIELEDNKYMARGRELEPILLNRYNLKELASYEPVIAVKSLNDEIGDNRIMASLDGYDVEASRPILEIKSTSRADTEWSELVNYYCWQVYHQMYVTEEDKAMLMIADAQTAKKVMYYPINDIERHLTRTEWLEYCGEFLEMLDNFMALNDDTITHYISIDEEIKKLIKEKEELRQKLIEKNPHGLVADNITISLSTKEDINYQALVDDNKLTMDDEYRQVTYDYKKFVSDKKINIEDKYKTTKEIYTIRIK